MKFENYKIEKDNYGFEFVKNDIKLSLYQRVMLRVLHCKENLKGRMLSKRLENYYKIFFHLIMLDKDVKVGLYEKDKEYKEMTRDEAIVYIYNKIYNKLK